jgi:hypothetical protein
MIRLIKFAFRLIITKWRRCWSPISLPPQSHDVPQLWHENEAGDKWFPDYARGWTDAPEGFIYQHVEFPLEMNHRIVASRDGQDSEIFSGNRKMSRDTSEVILAMCANGYTLDNAMLIIAHACERCLNVLYWEHGFRGGYRHKSRDWGRAGTSCLYCAHEAESPDKVVLLELKIDPAEPLNGFPHDKELRA